MIAIATPRVDPLPRRSAWDVLPKADLREILDLSNAVISQHERKSDWAPNQPSPSEWTVQYALARFTPDFLQQTGLDWRVVRTLKDFLACRTSYVDELVLECDNCKRRVGVPASCRRRGCATCGGVLREIWKAAHIAELLDDDYLHFGFTLPSDLRDLAQCNPDAVLDALMKAAYRTLKTTGLEAIGAEIGGTVVLQTWGGGLAYVPHVHIFIPAGGIASGKWVAWRKSKMPQEGKVGRHYHHLLIELLKKEFHKKPPTLGAQMAELRDPRRLEEFLDNVRLTEGLAWFKRYEENAKGIVNYLGDHINGRPIRDTDILGVDDSGVILRASGRSLHGDKRVTLSGVEFVKEYLSHQLPKGFVAVRSFGALVGSKKAETIAAIKGRSVLETREELRRRRKEIEKEVRQALQLRYGPASRECDACGKGRLVLRRVKKEVRKGIVIDMKEWVGLDSS